MTEADYPYTDGLTGVTTTTCSWNSGDAIVKANGFSFVPANNPKQMQAALNLGPISVGVDASTTTFSNY